MKRIIMLFASFVLMLSFFLTGCSTPARVPEIDADTVFPVQAAFNRLAFPADDGFYYIMFDSYNDDYGLYRESSSGEREKLLDRQTEHLFRSGDELFFINSCDLFSYNIRTGRLEKLIKNCGEYVVWNGRIVFKYELHMYELGPDNYDEMDTLKMLTPEGEIETVSGIQADQVWVYDGELYFTSRDRLSGEKSYLTEVYRYDDGESRLIRSDRSLSNIKTFANLENGTVWFVREDKTYEIVDMKTGETVLSGNHRLNSDDFYDCYDFDSLIMSRDSVPNKYRKWIKVDPGDGYVLVSILDVNWGEKYVNGVRFMATTDVGYRVLAEENGRMRIVEVKGKR